MGSIAIRHKKDLSNFAEFFIYTKENIPDEYIQKYWNVSHLPDGDYELRVVSDGGKQGVKFSKIASGIIDRKALLVFGKPEPADGVLNFGEEISIAFSSNVDPAFLSKNNVSLITAGDSSKIEIADVG